MTAPLFDPDQRHTAARIAQHSPHWVVIRGTATRDYWAFPVFQVPAGTIAHHGDPAVVTRQMRQIQTAVAYQGHREASKDALVTSDHHRRHPGRVPPHRRQPCRP